MKKTLPHFLYAMLLLFLGMVFFYSPAEAAPPGFQIKTVVGGLNLPTDFAFAPDGRIFVAEKSGVVRIVEGGVLLDEPFVTLTDVNDFGDRGLISLALDPDFAANGYVYLLYTYENNPADYEGPKTGRLVRVTAQGNVVQPGSATVLLGSVGGNPAAPSCNDFATGTDCIPSDSSSHSVAVVRFSPSGYLWVGLGDGARFDDVDPNALRAQDLDSLAGKILRLNKDGSAPSGNPFFNGNPHANRSKVWNWGLRNPFRLGFHPENGLPVIGDVGWYSWEELNPGYAGANFGWPCREGAAPMERYGCTAASTTTDPLYAYGHNSEGTASITGGVFATGSYYPAPYNGAYFFGDYALNALYTAEIHGAGGQFEFHEVQDFDDNPSYPVAFAVGPDGAVYYLAIYTLPSYSGEIRKIAVADNKVPQARIGADTTAGPLPLAVQFSSSESYDEDGTIISYRWDFGDGATSSEPNPAHTYTRAGPWEVSLEVVDDGGAIGRATTITVYAGNTYPEVTIVAPEAGMRYRAGDTIVAEATGFDAEDGTLPESAFSWRVLTHHNTHIHVEKTATGTSLTMPISVDPGESGVYLEFEVTVRDSMGAEGRSSVKVYPEGFDPLFTLVEPRATPTLPYVGEPTTISTTVQNTGSPGRGDALMVLYQTAGVNLLEETFSVELAASATEEIAAVWTPAATGTYYVDFGTFDDSGNLQHWYWRALTLSVEEAPAGTTTPPAAFAPALSLVEAVPQTLSVGESVTLSAEVENAGGTGTAQLLIVGHQDNGNLFEATPTLQLDGSGLLRAEAVWTPAATGTYYVDVGVFSEDWSTLYAWEWHGAEITVTDAPATTTPTSSPPFTARLIAYSVVCEREADLPNWGVWHAAGYGDDLLDQSDVNRFLAENGDRCAPAADWEFEYGLSFPYPDNTLRGPSGLGAVFGPTDAQGRTEVEITFDTEGKQMWTRAVHQEGYVGFQGKTDQEDYSSEFYCNTDLWHYDNNEIIALEDGGEYYCLLLTAPEGTSTLPVFREVPWYQDGLPAEVEDWSWGVQTDFNSTDVLFDGSYSLKVTPTGVWDGLYLHRAPSEPSGVGDEIFVRVFSPEGGHRLALKSYDGAAKEFSARSFVLAQGWNTLTLTDLPALLSGVVLQNDSGKVEAPYYVDAILFRDQG